MDEHTLNDLLECSVCLDRLDTSSKVLPCQHTFCRKCLEVIYASRQELRCPECRILVDTKIEDLPTNVLLMRILEGMKNAASKQHSIINELTTEKIVPAEISAGGNGISAGSANSTANALNSNIADEERVRQQIQQQQIKQRQQQILQFQQQIQQQHQLHQQHNQSSVAQQQQQTQTSQMQQTQQRRCIVPHAYALYDFESNEPNDLKFKKGDLIFLKRKIDANWYVGQLKSSEGNFPINYVQVVVPLPSAQCVALYDFKMGPNEEEGCLTFKKGTVIQVLRRVDHNWAEGRIGSSIGIFPIAFVELNQLAKQLLEGYVLSASQQPSQHGFQAVNNEVRNLPPLPPVIDPTASVNNGESSTSSSSVSSTTNTASSSSNSSTTTSPTTTTSVNLPTSSNSASFHSMPNSPQSSKSTTPQHSVASNAQPSNSVRMRNTDLKHKRHSLNALLNSSGTALSIMQTNRHSAEILSVPNDFDNEPSCSSMSVAFEAQNIVDREQQIHTSNKPSTNNQHSTNIAQNETSTNTSSSSNLQQHARHNVLKTCVQQNIPPSMPWGYLALYPYKPRKADELELKKGCVYMVTERCLDGWFKGKNWKDVSGVFPGNYVTPLRARDQQQLMHSWKLVPPSATMQSTYQTAATVNLSQAQTTTNTTGIPLVSQQQLSPIYPTSMRNDLENINARLTLANITPHQAMPPDLPPRYLTISPTPPTAVNNTNISAKENRDKEAQKEKPTTTGCISTSSSSSSSTSSASTGLKKFLTHIKSRSKSPSTAVAVAAAAAAATSAANTQTHNNALHQQQPIHLQKSNAQLLQTKVANMSTASLTPVHVRSGSCPSQLLQNLPNDIHQNNMIENKKPAVTSNPQQSSPQNNYGSHRIKGPKERASLENTRPTIDSTLRSIYANQIQQQSALTANKCGQQYQQTPLPANANINFNNSTTAIHHRKSHSLDASNVLQSNPFTPTTSSFSKNSVGNADGSVAAIKTSGPQCNINAAAIHASATTKSTQNMSESRFRCVVPYPPNSEVELELQVGDIIFVYRKQKNGWYKGTNSRTYKTGLFPASFVEPEI